MATTTYEEIRTRVKELKSEERLRLLEELTSIIEAERDAEKAVRDWFSTDKPLTLEDRKTFLQLPLELRRRILEVQAERMAPYYENDTEWREWNAGDFIEY